MPFAIFRRNQKKLIAIFGIMAMLSFVVADTLPKLLAPSQGSNANPEVVQLYGKPVRRGDLESLARERYLANTFIGGLVQRGLIPPDRARSFGDTSMRANVDALILRNEADKLGLPVSSKTALKWLAAQTNDRLTDTIADEIVRDAYRGQAVSGEQVLLAIADQLRLQEVLQLPGPPDVTPLDIFQSYRDQNEKVSVHALPVKVADYLEKVPAPSTTDLEAFFDKYKDALPDPNSPTPGFKVPRRVRLEFLAIDLKALEDKYRAKLTEKQVRDAFEERKAELSRPPASLTSELPVDLFAGDPTAEITPRLFEEVRSTLETELARAEAEAEHTQKFERVREVMAEYQGKYEEAQPEGEGDDAPPVSKADLPPRPDLKALAAELGLTYESSPLLSRDAAEHYGEISHSKPGQSASQGAGPTFVDEVFDPKNGLYFALDLSDEDHAFLAWKTEDQAPYTPKFEEVRKDVEAAWRRDRARPLAKKAAEAIAEAARKQDGDLEKAAPKDRIITTEPISRLSRANFFAQEPARPNQIHQIPDAGEKLLDAVFDLEPKQVVIEPDKPELTYYVLALNARIESTFRELYAPFNTSDLRFLELMSRYEAEQARYSTWMASLRTQAGLKSDWVPPDEAARKSRRRGNAGPTG